jgi:hypothetical protein
MRRREEEEGGETPRGQQFFGIGSRGPTEQECFLLYHIIIIILNFFVAFCGKKKREKKDIRSGQDANETVVRQRDFALGKRCLEHKRRGKERMEEQKGTHPHHR